MVDNAQYDKHLTVLDLARHWDVSPKHVRKLIRSECLHAHRVGHVIRVSPEEIARYEHAQRMSS